MSITTRPSHPSRASRPSGASGPPKGSVPPGTNLVLVRGRLRAEPEWRTSATGDEMLQCDLLVHVDEGPAESVPVLWLDPPPSATRLVADQDVVVVGRVRRRFFRVGGAIATRTEVHAEAVVSARAGATVRRAVEGALVGIGVG